MQENVLQDFCYVVGCYCIDPGYSEFHSVLGSNGHQLLAVNGRFSMHIGLRQPDL